MNFKYCLTVLSLVSYIIILQLKGDLERSLTTKGYYLLLLVGNQVEGLLLERLLLKLPSVSASILWPVNSAQANI